jgi:hypothetical protein
MKATCRHAAWLVLMLLVASAAHADGVVSFSALPTDISGSPGSTVGWGYSITNNTGDWLETTNVDQGTFQHGTLTPLFDYPVIAPGATVTENFVFTNGTGIDIGLAEFAWDANAPAGFVNSGLFALSYELFSGDPILDPINAVDFGSGAVSAPYSVTVSSTSVPEPGSLYLALSGIGIALLLRKTLS